MALIGSIVNQGTLQGQINDANGYLTGVITNAGLLGGQVVAERGLKGDKGDTGDTGAAGADGFSPEASVSKVGDTATITITDKDGTTTTTLTDGIDGADGHSPVVTASKTDKTTTVYVDGSPIATLLDGNDGQDGQDGQDGADGYSPSASVSKVGSTATITITDKDETTTASISDGEQNVQSDWNEADNTKDDFIKNKPSIPSKTSDLNNDSLFARGNKATFYGTCTTSAGTAEKAVTCADFTSADLTAGVTIVVSFSVANTGAVADLTLNVNSTGAYHIKYNSAGTIANLGDKSYLKASTYMFYFDGTYWIITGYDTNTNTIGYTIRTNGLQIPVKTACYRYRICFTSPDGKYMIPANASTSTSATASKTVTTEKIDPFGRIIYYSYTTAISADGSIGTGYQMQQYNGVTLGYSFNRTGVALTMTAKKAVYVKCAPQTDGSAIIDASTPFVQDLPTTEDGKIYIFLGVATSATAIEFTLEHPVYYYKDGGIRQWTNASFGNGSVTDVTQNGTSVLDGTVAKVVTHDVPSGGSSGQVLSKSSGTDYDLAWTTVSGGGDVVYATSSDSASTVAKTATIVSGTLSTLTSGVQAIVKFAQTNTASSPTLNIGGTGAKSIKRYGTTAVGQNQNESWVAGSPVLFVYDGTNWVIAGWLNTTYSGGTSTGITTGTDNLNYIWSPKQIHDGIDGMATATPTASKNSKFDSNAHMNSTDMTTGSGGEVETFVNGLNVTGINAVDYIVEQGTSDIWTYVKWNSGKAECWGEKTWTITSWATWGSLYYGNPYAGATAYPTNLFTNTPIVNINVRTSVGDSLHGVDPTHSKTTTPSVFVIRATNGTNNITGYVSFHAIGKWK